MSEALELGPAGLNYGPEDKNNAQHYRLFTEWLQQASVPNLDAVNELPQQYAINLYPEIYKYGPYYNSWVTVLTNMVQILDAEDEATSLSFISDMLSLTSHFRSYSDDDSALYEHPQRYYRHYSFYPDMLNDVPVIKKLDEHDHAKQIYENLLTSMTPDEDFDQEWDSLTDDYFTMHLYQDLLYSMPQYRQHYGELLNFQRKWNLLRVVTLEQAS
jgi:hypothetical protein